MIYRRTVGFKREFRNLPPEIKRAARAKFALFSVNWRHPSLHCHKLTGVFCHGHQVTICMSPKSTAFCSSSIATSSFRFRLAPTASSRNEVAVARRSPTSVTDHVPGIAPLDHESLITPLPSAFPVSHIANFLLFSALSCSRRRS